MLKIKWPPEGDHGSGLASQRGARSGPQERFRDPLQRPNSWRFDQGDYRPNRCRALQIWSQIPQLLQTNALTC